MPIKVPVEVRQAAADFLKEFDADDRTATVIAILALGLNIERIQVGLSEVHQVCTQIRSQLRIPEPSAN